METAMTDVATPTAKEMLCPECGAFPMGTVETVIARFHPIIDEDDPVEYNGDTDLDTQQTMKRDGLGVLICENGHEYTSGRWG